MELKMDDENNVAYLSLKQNREAGDVDQVVTVHGFAGTGEINLDFRKDGALLGIEFLNAKRQLAGIKEDNEPKPLPEDYWETAG